MFADSEHQILPPPNQVYFLRYNPGRMGARKVVDFTCTVSAGGKLATFYRGRLFKFLFCYVDEDF